DVPVGAAHRIENVGDEKLVFIEIQRGSYLGEDDKHLTECGENGVILTSALPLSPHSVKCFPMKRFFSCTGRMQSSPVMAVSHSFTWIVRPPNLCAQERIASIRRSFSNAIV